MSCHPKTTSRDDGTACYLCDAPMKDIEALGAYLDDRGSLRQYPICLKCIRTAQRRRLDQQARETVVEWEARARVLSRTKTKCGPKP